MHGSEKWRLWELSKRKKQWFGVLSTVFEHSGIVSNTWKNIRALDCVSCSKIFLRAGNSPVVLNNSTDHAKPLFIALIDNTRNIAVFYGKLVSADLF